MQRSMIFHFPAPLNPDGGSGSQVRPLKMVEAFESLGYAVETISGFGSERRRQFNRIASKNSDSRNFSFIYSESTTIPNILTESTHLPLHPTLEIEIFHWAKSQGIPVGLFYRDIYWRFPNYRDTVPFFKRAISIPSYLLDWSMYRAYVDHLFLPSDSMAEFLPTVWPQVRMSSLPPGCSIQEPISQPQNSHPNRLRLFYVGGVSPPFYDLRPMLEQVSKDERVFLTLCCRPDEWSKAKDIYSPYIGSNIQIIHAKGGELAYHYANSDLMMLIRSPDPYLDFAMPIKVFESLGFGVPIFTTGSNEVARFIKQKKVGWVADQLEDVSHLLDFLISNPTEIQKMKQYLLSIRDNFSWRSRAQTVINILDKSTH